MVASSITGWLSQLSAARLRSLLGDCPEGASDWLRILAIEGLPQAQIRYGQLLLDGTGTAKQEENALHWFRRAARQGDLDAHNMIGRCLENGWGSEIDLALAAAHYHRAADAGHPWAQYNLGHLYLDGVGVGRDAYRAYRYYVSAAAQLHARAMNLAGRCCEQGWGTPRNSGAAADWYRRSAEAGYFRGQFNWASVLMTSDRVEEAALWFDRAARAGTPAVRQAVLRIAAAAASPGPLAVLAARLGAALSAPGA